MRRAKIIIMSVLIVAMFGMTSAGCGDSCDDKLEEVREANRIYREIRGADLGLAALYAYQDYCMECLDRSQEECIQ